MTQVWTGWRLIPRTTTRSGYCCRSLHRQCPKVCDTINYLFCFQSSYCFWSNALKLFSFAMYLYYIMYYNTVKGVIQLFFKLGFLDGVSIAQTKTPNTGNHQKNAHKAAKLVVSPQVNPIAILYYTPIALNSRRRANNPPGDFHRPDLLSRF